MAKFKEKSYWFKKPIFVEALSYEYLKSFIDDGKYNHFEGFPTSFNLTTWRDGPNEGKVCMVWWGADPPPGYIRSHGSGVLEKDGYVVAEKNIYGENTVTTYGSYFYEKYEEVTPYQVKVEYAFWILSKLLIVGGIALFIWSAMQRAKGG